MTDHDVTPPPMLADLALEELESAEDRLKQRQWGEVRELAILRYVVHADQRTGQWRSDTLDALADLLSDRPPAWWAHNRLGRLLASRHYGYSVTRTQAGQLLGIGRGAVSRLLRAGHLDPAQNNRITLDSVLAHAEKTRP